MEFTIDHPDFKNNKIVLKTRGVLRGLPKVFQYGTIVPRKWIILKGLNKYAVIDDKGNPRDLILKSHIYDPIPRISIDGLQIIVAKKLKWYEYVWACLPLALVIDGGAIGAAFGLIASFLNVGIFRREKPNLYKFGISAVITISSFVVYFVMATAINLWFNDPTSIKALRKVADDYNKSLPVMINDEIQLTSLIGLEKEMVYNEKFINADSGSDLLGKISQMKQNMIGYDCSTPDVYNGFLKKGVKVEYRYYDKNNVHIADADVLLSDCQ
jgi:hypothetical protein